MPTGTSSLLKSQKSCLTGLKSNSVSDKKEATGLGSSKPLNSSDLLAYSSGSNLLASSSGSNLLAGSSLSDHGCSTTTTTTTTTKAGVLRRDLISKVKLSGEAPLSSKSNLGSELISTYKSNHGSSQTNSSLSTHGSLSTHASRSIPNLSLSSHGPRSTPINSSLSTKANMCLTGLTAPQYQNTRTSGISHKLTGPVSTKTSNLLSATGNTLRTCHNSNLVGRSNDLVGRSSNLASHRPLTSLQGKPSSHVDSKPLLTTSRFNLSSTISGRMLSKPQTKSLTTLSSRVTSSVTSSGTLTKSKPTSSRIAVEATKQSRSAQEYKRETKLISKIIKPIDEETEGAPKYNFSSAHPEVTKKSLFISPDCDASLQPPTSSRVDVVGLKTTFLNGVATSLLSSPDFRNPRDPVLKALSDLGERLSRHDPEFILKLAIYTRLNLNIRTTANFLLALAAKIPSCRHYLRKYYSATIRIPSDWIEVAEIYQAFHDDSIKFGAIPTALRKVMGAKFTEFDSYQLGKYNKEKRKKKDKKKDGKEKEEERLKNYAADFPRLFGNETEDNSSEDDSSVVLSESETKKEIERLTFSLKQLVRKIHISEPVEYVMCLVGKKYPEDAEAFRKSRLPGMWEQDRAGKRMKLPTPETWETQISTKGNHARVWQDLIDHNKLPFMAMLRNIRNLVISGVSTKHHQWVIKKLNDERAVVNSKQFPFRFFSAYEVLEGLERMADGEEPPARRPRKGAPSKKPSKKKPPKEKPEIDKKLLQKYKTALDNAIKIATCYNVKPISGSTLIICNVGSNMNRPCTAARGLGKPRTVLEVGILLGLMCKYSCEESTMLIYGKKDSFTEVDVEDGTILHNMNRVMNTASGQNMTLTDGVIPFSFLTNMLLDRQQVDNIVLLTDTMKLHDQQGRCMMDFLQKYRHLVNPNLLFVSVDLSGSSSGISSTIQPEHPNDIYLAGYSDQILRFIAERGDSGQLTYVENIDKVFNLAEIKPPSLSSSASMEEENLSLTLSSEKTILSTLQSQKWRTLRVFISSTFKDMHGERDLLTRFVFPELRARAHSRQIHIYEVDLRWGVTENDARSNKALEICLEEISKSQYFIGLLSQRYGWVQEEYQVSDIPEFDWLKEFPLRKSITEVEMHHAALSDTDKAVGKAFFYFRDPSFLNEVPQQYKADFESESEEAMEKMEDLKSYIRTSGLEVYDNYPSKWLGKVDDKLLVGGLESFGKRVLDNLWNAIQRDYRDDETTGDAISQATAQHTAFEETRASSFIGRRKLLEKAKESLEESDNNLVLLTGKPGSGKSAFMAALAQEYTASHSNISNIKLVLSHFIGAAPGSSNISFLLNRLCHEMKRRFSVNRDIPEDYTDLVKEWPVFMEESVTSLENITSKLVIMIDGIDLLEEKYNGRSMDWIPDKIPDGIVLVMSGVEGGTGVTNLRRRKLPPSEVVIGPLDMYDKAEMVRKKLMKHRKTLDESPFNNQMKMLLTKKEATNPLFLHLACEELRVFGIYEEVSDYLKTMPTTISNLLQNVLMRLESEHTTEILSLSLIFLTLVRNGLLEYELSGVLKIALKELYPESGGILPPMVMSKLLRSLQTFLQPTGQEAQDRLSLAHKDIEKAVKLRYMQGADRSKETHLHMLLAKFYREQIDPLGNGTFKGNSVRGFVELPYHLMEAGAWSELEDVVCNFRFVVSKCEQGLAQQLLEDYTPTVVGLPKGKVRDLVKFIQLPSVLNFKSFVSRNLHILLANPSLTLQQAFNEPTSSLIARTSKDIQQEEGSTNPMMIWVNKPETSNPCQMTISSQSSHVLCVGVSLDCSLFAAGFKNGAVRVYEVATGKEAHTFIGHASGIADVCFVGPFNYVCSASHDATLSLWDTKSGIRVATMKGHSRGVHGCAANRSGKSVVSVSWDTTIKVWEGRTGKLVNTLKTQGQHNTPINCVSFHPEGQLVAVGSWDKTLKIWDTFNQKRLKVLKGHKSSVQVCAYAPSGRHVVSAALDGEVKVWSTRSGTSVGTIVGHHSPVNALAFTPNGQFLVTGSSDKVLKVWSGSLGQPIKSISSSSSDSGFVHEVVFDHLNQLVGVGYHDGHVRQFNLQTGAEVFVVKPHSAAIVGLANHSNLHMSASVDGTIKVWDHASLPKSILLKGHTSPLTCAVWDKNGFASASEDFSILVWPKKTNTYTNLLTEKASPFKNKKKSKNTPPKQEVQTERELAVKPLVTLRGKHTAKITSLAFSCDSIKLAAVSHDQSITVWNCLSYQIMQTLHSCHTDWITTCQFSDISADVLVTGSSDFTLKMWDMSCGKEKATFKGHTSAINSVSFSQGCIVSASFDGSVKVWTQKGVEITTMYCHKQRTNTCLLHIPSRAQANKIISSWADVEEEEDDSRMKLEDIVVLTGSDDGTVGVWKPFLPNEIASLIGHSDRVLSVATTVNNQFLTSSLDGTIRVWNPPLHTTTTPVERGGLALVNTSQGHTGPITTLSAATTTPGAESYVVSGGRDGYVIIWEVRTKEGDDSTISKLYQVKDSEKAVSSVCLTTAFQDVPRATNFVSGSDAGTLNIYSFSKTASPKVVSNIGEDTLMGPHPISKVTGIPGSNSIVASSWSNRVAAIGKNKSVLDRMDKHKDWVVDLVIADQHIYSLGLDNVMYSWRLPSGTDLTSSSAIRHPLNLKSHDGRTSVWPLSLCHVQGTLYLAISDSEGQVSLWNREAKKTDLTKKLHNKQINVVTSVSNKCFMTGSDDSTVKVWKIQGKGRTTAIVQVGQFYCRSCITAITKAENNSKNAQPEFVVGDSLGHVMLLRWTH